MTLNDVTVIITFKLKHKPSVHNLKMHNYISCRLSNEDIGKKGYVYFRSRLAYAGCACSLRTDWLAPSKGFS